MALGSTVVAFDIELADVDRGEYASLALKVAQHPSESAPYLVARVLAYALEHTEGIAFTPGGLSSADEPAVDVRDLTGRRIAWIEVGTPDSARLHKASKAAERVAVYCHKDPAAWLRALAAGKVFEPSRIALWALPRDAVSRLGDALARRNTWSLTRTEGTVYLEAGDTSVQLAVERLPWPG